MTPNNSSSKLLYIIYIINYFKVNFLFENTTRNTNNVENIIKFKSSNL